jgi:hypothetical protein
MRNAANNPLAAFPGAGYLLGGAVTMLIGILLFAWKEDITVAISAAVPIGVTMGIILEQRLQQGAAPVSEKGRRIILALLVLGVLAFLAVIFLI